MRTTLATRKPVTDITVPDLEAFPVWEFAIDEEDVEGQDETWVKPLPSSQIPNDGLSLSVAAALRLPGGNVYPGILFCNTYAGFDVLAVAILITTGRVLFSRNDSISETQSSLLRLGLSTAQVFPLQYCTRAPAARSGEFEQGVFTASLA